jgi:glutathione S-transferase
MSITALQQEHSMIRLHGFGPAFGLPDPSAFVTKAEVLLKMAGLAYQCAPGDFKTNPKGKIPYIIDEGLVVGDSTLIRFHIEQKYGFDFDAGASTADLGAAWAIEKMCEDHLYWPVVAQRWMDKGNFERGPAMFFKGIPAFIRPLVLWMVNRKIKRNLYGQGFGRYSEAEGRAIVARDLAYLAGYLEGREYLGGAQPCGSDATLFAFLISLTVPTIFTGYPGEEARKHPAFAAYVARMQTRYYPNGLVPPKG